MLKNYSNGINRNSLNSQRFHCIHYVSIYFVVLYAKSSITHFIASVVILSCFCCTLRLFSAYLHCVKQKGLTTQHDWNNCQYVGIIVMNRRNKVLVRLFSYNVSKMSSQQKKCNVSRLFLRKFQAHCALCWLFSH